MQDNIKNEDIKNYISDVIDNPDRHCKYEQQAVKRFLKDFENKNIFFDYESVENYLYFFSILKHVKGEWAGSKLKLEPWQKFIVYNVFGWKKKDTNTRRYKTVYIEVPRKNGKSSFMAGLSLAIFFIDKEAGAEIYCASTKKDQSRIVFEIARDMIKNVKSLNDRAKIVKSNIAIIETASKFEPLGADDDTMDGLNVHLAVIDELHAHKTRGVWDVLDEATGSRTQPIIAAITTAGFNKQSVCWEQHEYLEKILEGVIEDDSYFGMIFTIDEGDDWEDESSWYKANPNLGISVKLDDFKKLAQQAKEIPSKQNSFKRKKLNIWTEAESRWLTEDNWNKGSGIIPEELKGNCYAGLDLSSTLDITALVLVFAKETEEDKYNILCDFFMPADNVYKRVKKDRVPYDVWIEQGYITATPGNVIDYNFIIDRIDYYAQTYDLQEIAYDRWGATKIVQDIQEKGMTVVPFGQGFGSMSPACKDLERMLMSGQLNHGDNPVLRWMSSNAVIVENPAGDIKMDKSKSTEKVDGMIALAMALDRALRNVDNTSIYETEDLLII